MNVDTGDGAGIVVGVGEFGEFEDEIRILTVDIVAVEAADAEAEFI
jgi:hypothetical protein